MLSPCLCTRVFSALRSNFPLLMRCWTSPSLDSSPWRIFVRRIASPRATASRARSASGAARRSTALTKVVATGMPACPSSIAFAAESTTRSKAAEPSALAIAQYTTWAMFRKKTRGVRRQIMRATKALAHWAQYAPSGTSSSAPTTKKLIWPGTKVQPITMTKFQTIIGIHSALHTPMTSLSRDLRMPSSTSSASCTSTVPPTTISCMSDKSVSPSAAFSISRSWTSMLLARTALKPPDNELSKRQWLTTSIPEITQAMHVHARIPGMSHGAP
mmetsp:Transcript_30398/g.92050  ORF Transcript_30398/g.92050 Transcript_30398/m.92050 type:complete len:273 (-) Transcript_30398:417-1235(-)